MYIDIYIYIQVISFYLKMGTDHKLNGILALRIHFTLNASLR